MALPLGNISLVNLDEVTDSPAQSRAQLLELTTQFNALVEFLQQGGSSIIGEIKILAYIPTTLPSGWIECNGVSLSRTVYASLFATIGTTYGSTSSTTFNVPNYNGRVIMGRGGTVSGINNTIGSTGGSDTVTLTVSQMPGHTHSVTVNSAGSHRHSVTGLSGTTSTTGNHYHFLFDNGVHYGTGRPTTNTEFLALLRGANGDWSYELAASWLSTTQPTHGRSNTTGAHSHTVSISGNMGYTGSHSHTGAATSTGGNQAHSNLQPSIVQFFMIYTGV